MQLGLEHLIVVAAGIAGIAALPWVVAALFGAAAFLCVSLASPAIEVGSLDSQRIRAVAGTTLIGAGQCCLSWAIGLGTRVLAGF